MIYLDGLLHFLATNCAVEGMTMIISWSHGAADENMNEAILVELGGLIARHPWWYARSRLVLELLRNIGVSDEARILEVGCGWGTNLAALENAGYSVAGLDISRHALDRLDRPGRTLIEADLSKDLPAGAPLYDVVLALDVIEHVDDDRDVVRCLTQLVRPGGRVIISVPALPDLFSEFDRVQGHRRRYTPDMLRTAIEGSGLTITDLFWWGQWMARILGRRKSKTRGRPGETSAQIYARYLTLPPWPAPFLMKLIYRFDQRRALRGRNETGTSLFAISVRL
jgi:2-polyprenyl-3-methyl-5-hydroxy-6-metoxy-1,4-benzoquinol methylase